MEVNELINLIVNNGFPVAVAAYLLIRLEKQINAYQFQLISLIPINKLNTIISIKLVGVMGNDSSGDDSHKIA